MWSCHWKEADSYGEEAGRKSHRRSLVGTARGEGGLSVLTPSLSFFPAPQIKKAFFAMVANGVRAAPLWDSKKQSFVGEERWLGRIWCRDADRVGSSMSLALRPNLPLPHICHLSILQACSPSPTSSWCCTGTTDPPW